MAGDQVATEAVAKAERALKVHKRVRVGACSMALVDGHGLLSSRSKPTSLAFDVVLTRRRRDASLLQADVKLALSELLADGAPTSSLRFLLSTPSTSREPTKPVPPVMACDAHVTAEMGSATGVACARRGT